MMHKVIQNIAARQEQSMNQSIKMHLMKEESS